MAVSCSTGSTSVDVDNNNGGNNGGGSSRLPPPKPVKTAEVKAFASALLGRPAAQTRASVRRLDGQGRVSQLRLTMEQRGAGGGGGGGGGGPGSRWRSEENLCLMQDRRTGGSGVGAWRRGGGTAADTIVEERTPTASPRQSDVEDGGGVGGGGEPAARLRQTRTLAPSARCGANVRSMVEAFESKSSGGAAAAAAGTGRWQQQKLSSAFSTSAINFLGVSMKQQRSASLVSDEGVYADADLLEAREENIYDVAGYAHRRTASVEDLAGESEYASVQVRPLRAATDASSNSSTAPGSSSVPTLLLHQQLLQQQPSRSQLLVQEKVCDAFSAFRKLAAVSVQQQQQQQLLLHHPIVSASASAASSSNSAVNSDAGDSDEEEDGSRSNVSAEVADRVKRAEQLTQRSEAVLLSGQAAKRSRQDQLFSGCCIISLSLDSGELSTEFCHPASFAATDFCKSLPSFCFPDAGSIRQRAAQPQQLAAYLLDCESFSFVMTEQWATRYYGYCLRYQLAEASLKRVEAVCIVSCVDSEQLFRQVLVETRVKCEYNGRDDAQEFLVSVYNRPLPKAGGWFDVTTTDPSSCGRVVSRRFNRPASGRMQHVRFAELLTFPGVHNTLLLFAAALHERKIVLVSANPRRLSQCAQALVALMYPLQWQHTFVPIVPSQMVHIVCSPTPYIVGVLLPDLDTVLKEDLEDDVVVVSLDDGRFLRSRGDEKSLISKKLHRALFRCLDANRQLEAKQPGCTDLLIVSTFLRFFAVVIGHYELCVAMQAPSGKRQFNKDSFCSAPRSKGLRSLLKVMTETGNFHIFISDVLDGSAYEANKLTVSSVVSDFNNAVREFREDVEANEGKGFLDSFRNKMRRFFAVTRADAQQKTATLSSSYQTRVNYSLRPQAPQLHHPQVQLQVPQLPI